MYTNHRPAIEALIGRRLRRDEAVHHIDNDPSNDAPCNLAVMSQSDHIRLHAHLRMIAKRGGDGAREFLRRKLEPPQKRVDPLEEPTFRRQLNSWKRWLRT